jgi:hypothetical protein
MTPLDNLLAQSLRDFESWLLQTGWRGKEHDCVNLFTHGHLFPRVGSASPIREFTEVGIEIGVPQPSQIGIKAACRKDLVIWDEPRATAWDTATWLPVRPPRAIIEWKAHRKPVRYSLHQGDIDWLTAYSLHFPAFTGYVVTVDFTWTDRRIASGFIRGGILTRDFHGSP